jgi:hypothetical protein
MTISVEEAIQQFLAIAREAQAESTLTAESVVECVIRFYRDVRIAGADIESDGDMLLLQWGTIEPLLADQPADLRNASDDDLRFDETERKYLDFTRQVFAGDEEDAEFDDSAIQLSMTLTYGPATGDEPSSNQWIHQPKGIDRGIKRLRAVPFVAGLWGLRPDRLVATVNYCG